MQTERELNPHALFDMSRRLKRRWIAIVAGEPLVDRNGNKRRFATEESALEAAELDAFLRGEPA